eukprot:407349_1
MLVKNKLDIAYSYPDIYVHSSLCNNNFNKPMIIKSVHHHHGKKQLKYTHIIVIERIVFIIISIILNVLEECLMKSIYFQIEQIAQRSFFGFIECPIGIENWDLLND